MKTQIVGLKGQTKERISTNDEAVTAFFREMTLLQRIEPVLTELAAIILESRNAPDRQSALPRYCGNILRIFRRTYFKALPADGLDGCAALHWERLGQVIGAGTSALRFGETQLQDLLKPEGLDNLSQEEMARLVRMVFASGHDEAAQSELWPQLPDATVQDMVASHFAITAPELWERFAICNQAACQGGPDSMTAFNAGMVKGMAGFVDESGQFVGETERANIYWFLLIAWPEIQAMQEARPPKTRNDFDEWLRPFVDCNLLSISSFSQLLDICDDIGLTFKGRGAPRKK